MGEGGEGGAGNMAVGAVRRGPGKGLPQLRPAPSNAIPEERLDLFFAQLAATANGKGSARAAGISHSVVWRARQRDAAFRARWDAALEEGYARLEEQVLAGALAGTTAARPRSAAGLKLLAQSQGVAMKLLAMNAARVAQIRARASAGRDPDEVLNEIKDKLRTIRARQEREG